MPDLTFGFDAGPAPTLIALHTVAAAIMVPLAGARAHAPTGRTADLKALSSRCQTTSHADDRTPEAFEQR